MRLILGTLCALVLAGCGGGNNGNNDGGGGGGGATLKSSIDVSHVVGFALSSSGAGARAAWPEASDGGVSSSMSTLYAIDDQGNLTVTTLTTFSGDGAGADLSTTGMSSSVAPNAIYDTPRYVLFQFDNLMVDMSSCEYVILRKSDGALYCLPAAPPGALLNGGSSVVDSDGADRLFVNSSNGGVLGGLLRVDMSGGAPQAISVSDEPGSFTVNHDADALIAINNNGTKATRIVKLNGGLQNILADTSLLQWLDAGGHDFFFISYATSPGFDVHRSTRQSDGSYVDAVVGTLSMTQFNYQWRLALSTPTVAYGWSILPTGSSGIVELSGAGFGTVHAVTGLSAVVDARGVGSSIFVQGTDAAGNGGIVRVDVPALTQTTILPPGDFTLSAISVSKTGELTFAGLRNSDGAHVVGNVAAGASTYTILSATAPVVTTLTRIN